MKRRQFIAGLGSAAAWPVVARAQQPDRARRIGVLLAAAEGDPLIRIVLPTLRQQLEKLGWIEGRNMRLDVRLVGTDPNRIAAAARELVGLAPDLIFISGGTEPVNAVQRQTQTIPIVFGGVGAAGESGYRTSLENIARPEGNATGFPDTFCSLGGRWLQLLKDAAPPLARVAVIFNPDLNRLIQGGGCYAASINAGAPVLAIQVTWMPYRTAAELDRAIDAFAAEPNGGLLLLPPNGHFGAVRETIYRLATEHRLPTIYSQSDFVKDGGLMSYGANYADLIRQSASHVDRILRGTKPGDLPVQLPTKFELVINLKTAKALGLTIPETLLATADEVIQ